MKKATRILGVILALALVFTFAIPSSAAGLSDLTKKASGSSSLAKLTATKNLTATNNITGTKKAQEPSENVPTQASEVVSEEASDKAASDAAETTGANANNNASSKGNTKKTIANTGDAGLAAAGAVAAVAAAAFVVSKKRA